MPIDEDSGAARCQEQLGQQDSQSVHGIALHVGQHDQLLLRLIPLNSQGHVLHAISGGVALYLGVARLRG